MTRQIIGLGAAANSNSGDTLRVAGDKINDNFSELYTLLQLTDSGGISLEDLINLIDSSVGDQIGSGGGGGGGVDSATLANITTLIERLDVIDTIIDSDVDASATARSTLLTYIDVNGLDITVLSQDIVDLRVTLGTFLSSLFS